MKYFGQKYINNISNSDLSWWIKPQTLSGKQLTLKPQSIFNDDQRYDDGERSEMLKKLPSLCWWTTRSL